MKNEIASQQLTEGERSLGFGNVKLGDDGELLYDEESAIVKMLAVLESELEFEDDDEEVIDPGDDLGLIFAEDGRSREDLLIDLYFRALITWYCLVMPVSTATALIAGLNVHFDINLSVACFNVLAAGWFGPGILAVGIGQLSNEYLLSNQHNPKRRSPTRAGNISAISHKGS